MKALFCFKATNYTYIKALFLNWWVAIWVGREKVVKNIDIHMQLTLNMSIIL